jgi:hypothetical protein
VLVGARAHVLAERCLQFIYHCLFESLLREAKAFSLTCLICVQEGACVDVVFILLYI